MNIILPHRRTAVFQGPIYAVRVKGQDVEVQPVEHVQLHHAASLAGRTYQLQIDVVSESALSALVENILLELRMATSRMNNFYDRLIKSATDQKQVAAQNQARARLSNLHGAF